MENSRYETGLKRLAAVDGQAGEKVVDSLKSVAPDLGRYIVEFAFGDIYDRPGLTLAEREMIPWRFIPRRWLDGLRPLFWRLRLPSWRTGRGTGAKW